MVASERKVHRLKIDTASIKDTSIAPIKQQTSSLPSLSSWSDENDTEEEFVESPKQIVTHDWENKIFIKTQDVKFSTRNKDHHSLTQTLIRNPSDSKKNSWFQISRNALRRYLSTPPTRRGYGGLKAGYVEPPEPPPQLLFNLQWSVTKRDANDFKNHASSTPSSPALKRHSLIVTDTDCNNIRPELSFTAFPINSPSTPPPPLSSSSSSSSLSSSSSSPSTPSSLFLRKAKVTRRCSLPVPELATKNQKKKTFVRSLTRSPGSITLLSPEEDNKFNIPTLYFSDGEPVIIFSNIKSRKHKLHRKISLKSEYNVLCIWRSYLNDALTKRLENRSKQLKKIVPLEKKQSYLLTRKFIIQEFYTTEITYWNQLNYIKVMYHDTLQLAVQRNSPFVRPSDMDWFANLSDLMEFSSNIIYQLQHYEHHFRTANCNNCPEIHIGKILCEAAESMAVFLHCALDYQANIKLMNEKKGNKGYSLYRDKLSLKKETRQFTIQDYLIVPIQRITRYGLLLADLEKHTEADDVDYKDIQTARDIIHSLALAMNYAQK